MLINRANAMTHVDKPCGTARRDKPTWESGRKPHRAAIFFLKKSVTRKSAKRFLGFFLMNLKKKRKKNSGNLRKC